MRKRLEDIHSRVQVWLEEAASMIKNSYSTELTIHTKQDHKDLVTNIDAAVQHFLIKKINEYYPSHSIVGEESGIVDMGENHEHVWIIDPIDGTANFVKQKDHYCILLSYYELGIGKLGYIYDVMNEHLYYAIENEGAYMDRKQIDSPPEIPLHEGLVSVDVRNWSGKPCLEDLFQKCFDIRYFGCGGIDSIHVFTGKFAAFAASIAGPWDLAAQLIFAKELGLSVSRFDGNDIHYLQGGNWVISNKAAYNDLLEILKTF